MINHRERFPQWCSEKKKKEVTTEGILDVGCSKSNHRKESRRDGKLNKYSVVN